MNPEMKTKILWDNHYKKEKSKLKYPDENLVRILSSLPNRGKALDFGAGSGRHSVLLKDFGFEVYAADYSEKSIEQIQLLNLDIHTSIVGSPPFRLQSEEFDLIVNWGVLHYNTLEESIKILKEFYRILKPGGILAGTIRSKNDTYLKVKNTEIQIEDLKGGQIFLYSFDELKDLLKDFSYSEFGYSERSPIGKLEERICHWIFKARK
ncbi:MAG: class I SAM-dependent methyltransferase [Leptospiraceae bacterium]|nr:class I SAM-dependent methyltransferase [Leptospiraceae bacterium]MCK6379704.1 class I SAM-dependent methyltransferase [Leptospiraceae bacterium]NUM40508.1 class I SAM-dependent methyltransferase [Leptospiraceae bacterium]